MNFTLWVQRLPPGINITPVENEWSIVIPLSPENPLVLISPPLRMSGLEWSQIQIQNLLEQKSFFLHNT